MEEWRQETAAAAAAVAAVDCFFFFFFPAPSLSTTVVVSADPLMTTREERQEVGHLVLETSSQTFTVLQSADPIRQREEERTHARKRHTRAADTYTQSSGSYCSARVNVFLHFLDSGHFCVFWPKQHPLAVKLSVAKRKKRGQHGGGTKLAFCVFGQQGPPELAANRL